MAVPKKATDTLGWAPAALVVLALLAASVAVVPTASSTPDQSRYNQERAAFLATFGGANPGRSITVYHNDEVVELSVMEAADRFAARAVDFYNAVEAEAADSKRGRSDKGSGSSSGASSANGQAVAYTGAFTLWEEANLPHNPTVACSDLAENRHATFWLENPAPHYPAREYIGAAYSNVAAYGAGSVTDAVTGTAVYPYYDHPVYYAGTSDFWCAELPTPSGMKILNQPQVFGGFVIGADV